MNNPYQPNQYNIQFSVNNQAPIKNKTKTTITKKNLIENSENDDESSVENESRMGGKKTLKNIKSENFEKNLKKSNKKKKYSR